MADTTNPRLFTERRAAQLKVATGGTVASTGGGGDDGPMDPRIDNLEKLATSTERRVESIEKVLPTLATKDGVAAAVSEAKSSIITWTASLVIGATVMTITILSIVLSRVAPPAPTQNVPQPIVIQLPAQQAATQQPAPAEKK